MIASIHWAVLGLDVTFSSVKEAALWFTALSVAIGVVGHGVRVTVRFFRRIERVVLAVEDQLLPNCGSTLRDAVTSIQIAVGVQPTLPPRDIMDKREERKGRSRR